MTSRKSGSPKLPFKYKMKCDVESSLYENLVIIYYFPHVIIRLLGGVRRGKKE